MSAETYRELEEALAAHIADEDEPGRIVTDWYLIAAHVGSVPDETRYTHVCSDSPAHSLLGLLWDATRRIDRGDDE